LRRGRSGRGPSRQEPGPDTRRGAQLHRYAYVPTPRPSLERPSRRGIFARVGEACPSAPPPATLIGPEGVGAASSSRTAANSRGKTRSGMGRPRGLGDLRTARRKPTSVTVLTRSSSVRTKWVEGFEGFPSVRPIASWHPPVMARDGDRFDRHTFVL